MSYNVKIYEEQGGEKLVISSGAILQVDGTLKIGSSTVTVIANQLASTATDVAGLKTDFNALLTKLKASGLMTADA